MALRIATYARVSTADQADTGTSLADQERRLRAAVTARDGHLVEHFIDPGVSGVVDSRPGLDRLRATVRAGGVDVVMATKIDRVSRSAVGLLGLIDELRHSRCHLVLIDEGLDTSTAAGDLTSGLLGVIGGWERRRIAERTKAGRRAAAEIEGRFVGSTPPFGFRSVRSPTGRGMRLHIHDDQAATIRRLFEVVVAQGLSLPDAVTTLNAEDHRAPRGQAWTHASLARWVMRREPVRAAGGVWVFDGIQTTIPAILSPDEVLTWQEWQTARRHPDNRSRGPYLLSGMVVMPCGRTAMGRTAGKQRSTYSCRRHYLPQGNPDRHDSCGNVPCALVEEIVVDHVRQELTQVDVLKDAARQRLQGLDSAGDLPSLRAQLARVERSLADEAKLFRDQGYGGATLVAVLAPLHEHRQTLARQIAREQRLRNVHKSPDLEVAHFAHVMRDGLDQATKPTWRMILQILQTRIIIDRYDPCSECGGTQYHALTPGVGRHWPTPCRTCLRGLVPALTIEIDDVAAANLIDELDVDVS